LPYHLIVQRKNGLTRADYTVHEGPTPPVGTVVHHEVGDAAMRIMVTGIRPLPPNSLATQAIDQITAVEL
jgi:hypothetical protein